MSRKFSQKILISTNSSCNLKCVYCFEKNKTNYEFDVDTAISIIGKFLTTKTEYGTKIKIWGGEPFLVFDKIKLFCERLWSMDFPEYYNVSITTNGTLVHGEIMDWLYKHRDRITVKLSIDGAKLSNDINRPNSFDKIDIPFFVKTWPWVVASMTITPMTLPYLYENIKFLHASGFQNIIFQLSLLTDWSRYDLFEEYYHQITMLCKYYLDNPDVIPCFSWLKIERTLKPIRPMCGIGHMTAYDFQSNQYYPCQMCFPSACGEELSKELQCIDFDSPDCLADDHCKMCPFVNLCVTCYAENYTSRGSANKRDMNICDYQKVLFAAVYEYEYERILKAEKPSSSDLLKMQAIQRCLPEINKIWSKKLE